MTRKRIITVLLVLLSVTVLAVAADAQEKLNGRVKSMDLGTNTVVVTSYDGQDVSIFISAEDTSTLEKLKDGRIKVGDDVKVKYITRDGRNAATSFRKPAGC